jgi:hypothetical protein
MIQPSANHRSAGYLHSGTRYSVSRLARKRLRAALLSLGLWWMCVSCLAASDSRHSDPLPDFSYLRGWFGADDAYSVPISRDESIWLFGDTFVGDLDMKFRNQYKAMVRNSIGVSTCKPGSNCTMQYFWQKPNTAKPRSFVDTGTDDLWYWPMDGFWDGKTLFVALMAVRNKPGAASGDAFGFEIAGTKLAVIANARSSPQKWQVSVRDLTDARLWAGSSMVPFGDYVLWYTRVVEGDGRGYMAVMRVPRNKMADPSGSWEYLRKDGHWAAGLAREDAEHVIEQPISEMSVRFHPSVNKWLALSTGPEFPSPRAVVRSADSAIGPWSDPQTVYNFPETMRDHPGYDKDTFCYAVKEHVELTDTKIALTYACNSMAVAKTIQNMNIYRPRVVILDIPK